MNHPPFVLRLSHLLRGFWVAPLVAACTAANAQVDATAAATAEAAAPLAPPDQETLLVQQPTISAHHIVFGYANDLWVVGRDGGDARRLTSSPGAEAAAQLSPDGTLVAFTGEYEGNPDVYVMPVTGGTPRRLTWHPGADVVCDWHPDGSGVVFGSRRESTTGTKLYLASLAGGTPVALELPKANHASLDADASHFVYTPVRDAFATWKRYRGGRTSPVWIFDRTTYEVEEIPHVNATDTFPRWIDGTVYFASDRDGVMNLFRYVPGSNEVTQLTRYTDFHIRGIDSGAGVLAFEQGGRIHVYDPATEEIETLKIRVAADGLAGLPRWQTVEGHVRAASPAPNGKRAVFEARGEIITVPREHGDARNLTKTPGVHERSPVWSPDGESIAWFSDESGEYQLVIRDRKGRGEAKSYELGGAGFYYNPMWSPDGEHILFSDKANRLAYLTVESGVVTTVCYVQGSLGVVFPNAVWAPDSKWLAVEMRNERTLYDHLELYELATGTMTSVTDDFAASSSPAFSRDGKYLYFFASVNRGPSFMGLNMATSAARDWDGNLYAAVLKADEENPLFPKSDDAVEDVDDDGKEDEEEEDADEDAEEGDDDGDEDGEEHADDGGGEHDADGFRDGDADDDETTEEGATEEEEEPEEPSIDLENLDQRIIALPVSSGLYGGLACIEDKLLFIEMNSDGPPSLKSFDFDSREAKDLESGIRGFTVSADGKSLLTQGRGGYSLTNATGGDAKGLGIDSVRVRVVPEEEWPQILREVWRIERDYFYDDNFHGVDWDAMWERWSAFLPHVQHRADLNLLNRELIGELCCGHEYTGGGELPEGPSGISVGLLGANFEIADGHYRIAEILRGQNWNPRSRAPLTAPGVDAKEGDYLLAVNDVPLDATQNLYHAFEYTADKQVDLTLATRVDGSDSRTVTVVPLSSDNGLRFGSWIEGNRRRVDELSGGRLAYIYMPNTGGQGMASFDRDFYSQLDKEGVILDERNNGGGQVADYVIDVLSRKVLSYWMNREKWLGVSPSGLIDGPKVMVINENAGSGGDWMPWAFQMQEIGPLVGTRTWGGLVGISGYPALVDGGMVTAANFGVMDPDGEWAVENVGISPDIEVIEWPKEVLAGHDPQLDRAVAEAMKLLESWPKKALPTYHAPTER